MIFLLYWEFHGIPIGVGSSTVEFEICGITAGIKTFESVIKKKRKKHFKVVLLAKDKLNTIEALILRL